MFSFKAFQHILFNVLCRSFLFLKPEDEDYEMCEAIDFEEIIKNEGTFLNRKCKPINPSKKPFIINVVPEKDNLTSLSVYSEYGWDLPYIMHLWPPILLRNLLPYKIVYYIEVFWNFIKYLCVCGFGTGDIY